MKPYTLGIITFFLAACVAQAGAPTESTQSKDTTGPQPCPAWYGDREWNLALSGSYAPTDTDYKNDRYLSVDHAFGGGVDAKYFFTRYFGLGVAGYILEADRTRIDREGSIFLSIPPRFSGIESRTKDAHLVGTALGTFTFRYPVQCTRFAPYAFVGGGGVFGGGQQDITIASIDPRLPNSVQVRTEHRGARSELVGQCGAGFEVRLTPHIGLINDFSWNVVNGPSNNFGVARTGINIAF
jgi:hypothetical protein